MRRIFSIVLLLSLLFLCACASGKVQRDRSDTTESLPTDGTLPVDETLPTDEILPTEQVLPPISGFSAQEGWQAVSQSGLDILAAGSYSGSFFEDGSDEAVEDIAAIVIRNTGAQTVEYGEVNAGTFHFVFTGLPVNAVMLVLESDRGAYSEMSGAQVAARVNAADVREDYDEAFEIYLGDGVINIRNISGTSFSEDVFVYYKNIQDGVLLGGITYRVRFDGVADGAIAQSIQSHATAEHTAVIYMTYDK